MTTSIRSAERTTPTQMECRRTCVSSLAYFRVYIWPPIISEVSSTCYPDTSVRVHADAYLHFFLLLPLRYSTIKACTINIYFTVLLYHRSTIRVYSKDTDLHLCIEVPCLKSRPILSLSHMHSAPLVGAIKEGCTSIGPGCYLDR